MCGIVGLFLKNTALEGGLGARLTAMLGEMGERGPDSAGFAVYRTPAAEGAVKFTLFHPDVDYPWGQVAHSFGAEFAVEAGVAQRGNHAVITVAAAAETFRHWLARHHPELRVMGYGARIEVFKDIGAPDAVAERFALGAMDGTHALGHTRMATESAVTTIHSHPFSVGAELCLVHNGSLSNHNRLRQVLRRQDIAFETDNDSEVAAGYFAWRLHQGATLPEAMEAGLKDLDGFYTFAVGTPEGFAVVRDPIACKPAILAETDDWVAMASEYRAIATLPGADDARIWEPQPATVYCWSRTAS